MIATQTTLAFFPFGQIGLPELLVIGVLGLLIFGKRLPEVGRSLGRGIIQFKKGLREVEDEVDVHGMEDSVKTLPPETPASKPSVAKPKESSGETATK